MPESSAPHRLQPRAPISFRRHPEVPARSAGLEGRRRPEHGPFILRGPLRGHLRMTVTQDITATAEPQPACPLSQFTTRRGRVTIVGGKRATRLLALWAA